MNKPFDEPNEKSLLQAKEYWEDNKELGEECLKNADTEEEKQDALNDIALANENLKDINARLNK